MADVTVVGGGPAGSMAALAALEAGARVTVFEKAAFPRHKVCGEFLSGEAIAAARRMGVWERLEAAGAAPIRRMLLQVGRTRLSTSVDEPLYGLSRYALDSNLLAEVAERGGRKVREKTKSRKPPTVIATGRSQSPPPGAEARDRLFGFKAHFSGTVGDAVELYLWDGCYVGVSPVEGGLTNVCGLAPLRMLGKGRFSPGDLIRGFAPLRERLGGLRREWDWLATGPVTFGRTPEATACDGLYPAGDALGFVDPFTGAGQSIAMLTGMLAGRAAATGRPAREHLRDCRGVSGRVFASARLFRIALELGGAGFLARFVRPEWLFHLTRPRLVRATVQ